MSEEEVKTVNSEPYQRWLDFAQRMARHGWPNLTEQRKQLLNDEVTEFIERYAEGPFPDWDGDYCICDDFREAFEIYDERRWCGDWPYHSFINQACCCVRAGLDVAGSPSAGVFGFTVGDLRRMYDGTIPDWIADGFESPQSLQAAGDAAGVWL